MAGSKQLLPQCVVGLHTHGQNDHVCGKLLHLAVLGALNEQLAVGKFHNLVIIK